MESFPQKELKELADTLLLDYEFLKKDWFITQVLKLVSQNFDLHFSGGTSLFKSKIIQRFSEDIDFLCTQKLTRKERSALINRLIETLLNHGFKLEDKKGHNQSQKYELLIQYQDNKVLIDHIRPHIVIEVIFDKPLEFSPKVLPASSLLNQTMKLPPEVSALSYVNPKQILTDKISALLWRVQEKEIQDYTIIRHLYDINSLLNTIELNDKISSLIERKIETDKTRIKNQKQTPFSTKDFGLQALSVLQESQIWHESYLNYVKNFCLDKKDYIEYLLALKKVEEIINKI